MIKFFCYLILNRIEMLLLILTSISVIIIGSVTGYLLYNKFINIENSLNSTNQISSAQFKKNLATIQELNNVDAETRNKLNQSIITDANFVINQYLYQY